MKAFAHRATEGERGRRSEPKAVPVPSERATEPMASSSQGIVDHRRGAVAQRELQAMVDRSPRVQRLGGVGSIGALRSLATPGARASARPMVSGSTPTAPLGSVAQREVLGTRNPRQTLSGRTEALDPGWRERRALDRVTISVLAFEEADAGLDLGQLVGALRALLVRIAKEIGRCPNTQADLLAVKAEASTMLHHALELHTLRLSIEATDEAAMTRPDFGQAKASSAASFKTYQSRGSTGDRNAAITAERELLNAALVERERAWRARTGATKDEWDYGDEEGDLSQDVADLLEDFGQVKDFLANKPKVLTHLVPLAQAIGDSADKLGAMLAELSRAEQAAGFGAAPVIPLGILPGEVFTDLIAGGNVIDDFGVGQQHGEQSHRIQWYAIIHGSDSGDLTLINDPIEIYKALGRAPFNLTRGGASMWGNILDKGTNASRPTYSAPGTLNRDLLESDPEMVREGPGAVGLAEREANYEPPDLVAVRPIGEALSALKRQRVELVQEHGTKVEKEDEMWIQYGVAPPSIAARVEAAYEQSPDYDVHEEGFDATGKPWKVMVRH